VDGWNIGLVRNAISFNYKISGNTIMHRPCAFIDLDTQVLPILEGKTQFSIIPSFQAL
jgi:hypothetical protein